MKNNFPYITIIIATKNAEKTLSRCLKSVFQQTYTNFELLIIDGNSSDNTRKILIENSRKIDWWISENDSGIYEAWNKGLKKAQGKWLCFLGADDMIYNKRVLMDTIKYLNFANNQKIDIVYGRSQIIDNKNKTRKILGASWNKINWQFKHGMPVHMPHTSMFQHINIFKKYGLFDQNFKIAGDYELLMREIKIRKNKVFFIPDQIITYKQEGGVSYTLKKQTIKEFKKARIKNNYNEVSILWYLVYTKIFLIDLFKQFMKI